ncbi:hypothetical protein [Acinetobacter rudis]
MSNQMTTSNSVVNLICSFEDLCLNAYDDGISFWTIGFCITVYPND